MGQPQLVVMRLCDMFNQHPDQDNSRICGTCGFKVGIYPSGQKIIKDNPNIILICQVCSVPMDKFGIPAPGAIEEAVEMRKRRRDGR
jgi:hypothetical protein